MALKHFPYVVANEQESKQRENQSETMPILNHELIGNHINFLSYFHS